MSVLSRWVLGEASAAMAIPLALQITMVVGLAWVLDRLLAQSPGRRPARGCGCLP